MSNFTGFKINMIIYCLDDLFRNILLEELFDSKIGLSLTHLLHNNRVKILSLIINSELFHCISVDCT
jgi:hypothetical protein